MNGMSNLHEDALPGRPLFDMLWPAMVAVFYVAAAAAVGVFFYGVWRRLNVYRKGVRGPRLTMFPRRLWQVILALGSHSRLARRNLVVGAAHVAIFFGFGVLFIGTVLITIDYDILKVLAPSLRFWHGQFYLWYSFLLDLFGLVLLIGLVV